MSCEFCKNFKGLNDICEDGFHYVETGNESLDCQSYQYNGKLKYYSYLSKKDELEVEQIMGNVIGYFIRIGFDDLNMATHDATESAKSLSKTLNESEYFTRFIQAGKQINMEAGAYNQAIRRILNEAK